MAADQPLAMGPFLVAAVVMIAAAAAGLRLIVDPAPLAEGAGALIGLDVILLGAVASLGMLLSRGRWSRNLAAVLIGFLFVMAAITDSDPSGIAVLALAALATLLVAGPLLTNWLRRLTPADSPPAEATALAIWLLAIPAVTGLAAPSGPGPLHWGAAIVGVLTGWLYSRASWAGLWSARLAVPAILIAAAFDSPIGGAAALVAAAVATAVLAWRSAAAVAVAQVAPTRVEGAAVPPEMVDPEVLRAAGLDERGRPLESG